MLQLQFIIVPSIAVFLLLLIGLFIFLDAKFGSGYDDGFAIAGFIAAVFAGLAIIVTLILFIPFQGKYLTIEHPSGEISSTSFKQGGVVIDGESETVYVVQLDGKSTQYVVNDDRITKYKIGDDVSLACTLQWNYGAKDQWNCSLAN